MDNLLKFTSNPSFFSQRHGTPSRLAGRIRRQRALPSFTPHFLTFFLAALAGRTGLPSLRCGRRRTTSFQKEEITPVPGLQTGKPGQQGVWTVHIESVQGYANVLKMESLAGMGGAAQAQGVPAAASLSLGKLRAGRGREHGGRASVKRPWRVKRLWRARHVDRSPHRAQSQQLRSQR